MLHGGRTIPCSTSVQSISECPLPDVVRRFIGLGHHWQQDGFGSVLKECRPVLSLAFLDPVAVDLEGARVNELADGFDGVRVALDHLLGDRFGAAVVAVDAHCGENSHADDLWEGVSELKEGNLQWKERTFGLHHWNVFHAEICLVVVPGGGLGFFCRTLSHGSDAHLEPPVWTELPHLIHNILGEERVVENIRSCESLLRVHHQHPRDLQKANTESLIHPFVTNLRTDWRFKGGRPNL